MTLLSENCGNWPENMPVYTHCGSAVPCNALRQRWCAVYCSEQLSEVSLLCYSKRHNKFLFPALAEAIYGSFCKAENEISNVVNYKNLTH